MIKQVKLGLRKTKFESAFSQHRLDISQPSVKKGICCPCPSAIENTIVLTLARKSHMDPNHRNGPGEPLTVIREGTFNGDPDAERCNQFRSRHSNLQLVRLDPLYVLPSELIG